MRIGVTGIVTNEYNHVLLIQRDDTHTWAAPAGGLEAAELPTDGTAREVKEETTMYVLPIRLVHIEFRRVPSGGYLHFTFRCMIRGGEPQATKEALQAGFFDPNKLPQPMYNLHVTRIDEALGHVGPADWETMGVQWSMLPISVWLQAIVYPWRRLKGWWQGREKRPQRAQWQVDAAVVVHDPDGRVWWTKNGRLPHTTLDGERAPWTAVRETAREAVAQPLELTELAGIYVHHGRSQMTLLFRAETDPSTPDLTAQPPAEADETHAAYVADALSGRTTTLVTYRPGTEPDAADEKTVTFEPR